MTTTVYNKKHNNAPSSAIYVGRPTVFGNPFTIGRDGTRDEVIKKFRDMLVVNPVLMKRVKSELKDKDLICWCAPLPCHADVLMWFANND